jgi:hypothetical protein
MSGTSMKGAALRKHATAAANACRSILVARRLERFSDAYDALMTRPAAMKT